MGCKIWWQGFRVNLVKMRLAESTLNDGDRTSVAGPLFYNNGQSPLMFGDSVDLTPKWSIFVVVTQFCLHYKSP